MIRVILPAHLRTLARVNGEVSVEISGEPTLVSVLNALETQYPVLRGTIRDQVTHERRPFVRFFACEEDYSHEPAETAAALRCRRGQRTVFNRRSNVRRLIFPAQ